MRVSYTAGYAAIPDDITLACMKYVAYLYSNPDKAGIASEHIGSYSVSFAQMDMAIASDIVQLLDQYRTLKV